MPPRAVRDLDFYDEEHGRSKGEPLLLHDGRFGPGRLSWSLQ
jgi:hypothetical protein